MGTRLFGLDAQTLFDCVLLGFNMLILFTLLSYLLFNPLRDMIQSRKDRIEKEKSEAAKNARDALTLKNEYQVKVDNAEEDAQAILRDARQRAQKNEEQIVSEAKEEAAHIIAHAKTEAELEKQKAADDIRKEIISVATVMAGKFIAVSVDEATQERLLEETLREIGDSTWQS